MWRLAKEFVALFGCLCLVFNVLLPAATLLLQFAAYDAPEQFAKWRACRAQQDERRRLEQRIALLTKRLQSTMATKQLTRNQRGVSGHSSQSEQATAKQTTVDPSAPPAQSGTYGDKKLSMRRRHGPPERKQPYKAASALEQKARAATTSIESPKATQSQRRHRLSIYSTVKKPPRPQDRAGSSENGR